MVLTSTTAQIVAEQKRYFNIKEQKAAKVTNIEIGNSIILIILFYIKLILKILNSGRHKPGTSGNNK